MFQKVVKTDNIGKKTTDYLLTVLFLESIFFFFFCIQIIGVYLDKCGIVYGICVSGQLRHSTGV